MVSVKKIFKAIKDFEKLVKFAAVDVNAPQNTSEALARLKINPRSFENPAQEINEALLKKVFRQQAKLAHPDISGDANMFTSLKSAYDYLVQRKTLYPEEFQFEIESMGKPPVDSPAPETPASERPKSRKTEQEFVQSDDYLTVPTRERAAPGTRTRTVEPIAKPNTPHGPPVGTPHGTPPALPARPTSGSPKLKGVGEHAFIIANVVQVLVDKFKQSKDLIEAAKTIKDTMADYNKDYGFGEIQQEANELSSNITEIINLFPRVSSVSVTSQNPNVTRAFIKDANQFIKTLSDLDQEITLVYSYLLENKGLGTSAINILEGVGASLGAETDAKTLLRTLSEFQSFAASYRLRLGEYLDELNSKVRSSRPVASAPDSRNSFLSEEIAPPPAKQIKNKPKYNSEIEEFANINF